jgi:hypothetical protein
MVCARPSVEVKRQRRVTTVPFGAVDVRRSSVTPVSASGGHVKPAGEK